MDQLSDGRRTPRRLILLGGGLSWLLNVLINTAARAFQAAETLFFNPSRQRRGLILELLFSDFRATVFAKPAVTQIEEMGCLVHGT